MRVGGDLVTNEQRSKSWERFITVAHSSQYGSDLRRSRGLENNTRGGHRQSYRAECSMNLHAIGYLDPLPTHGVL